MEILEKTFGRRDEDWHEEFYEDPAPVAGRPPLLHEWQDAWRWDELAAEIGRESQARLVIAGLRDAGKSLLFNRLRGWVISSDGLKDSREDGMAVEWYGAFVLVDLPEQEPPGGPPDGDLVLTLGEPALVLYVVDGQHGVRQADYRWVARLRASGRPVVVALNKCDVLQDPGAAVAEAQRRLGMPVIPISAQTGLNVEERLLPAMLDTAPHLAVPLGREIKTLRRLAARRVIRQAALFAGLMSAQPVPFLDLPFQATLQSGVVMRVGAAYGHTPSGGVSREMAGAVAGALGMHYLAQTLAKLVPPLGWAVGGALGAAATTLIGEAAIRYYEAGGTVPLPQWLRARKEQGYFRLKLRRWRANGDSAGSREQRSRLGWFRRFRPQPGGNGAGLMQ